MPRNFTLPASETGAHSTRDLHAAARSYEPISGSTAGSPSQMVTKLPLACKPRLKDMERVLQKPTGCLSSGDQRLPLLDHLPLRRRESFRSQIRDISSAAERV